jgi:hypothetical protein
MAPDPRPATVAVDDEPSVADVEAVTELIGRAPQGAFRIVVRHADGDPVVIRNEPLMADGTPMPTRFWLVGEPERTLVSRLESRGAIDVVEGELGLPVIAAAHDRYAAERDAALPRTWDGPRPTGGVGGTRKGVKCLHAHYAWFLTGGPDPVGAWVADRLAEGAGDRHPSVAAGGLTDG